MITLKATTLALSIIFSCTLAFGAKNDTDLNLLSTPTLDNLAGQEISGGNGVMYPNSGYSLTEVTPADTENLNDNIIIKYEINSKNETIPHYYEVNLSNTEYGSGAYKIYYNWEKDSGNYVLEEGASAISNNSIIYEYDPVNSLTRKTNPSGDIIGNFINQNTSRNGGAIYNSANLRGGDIVGDFVGNFISSYSNAEGGAIANNGTNGKSTIGSITGNFIGNYASSVSTSGRGGAIYNYYNASIGDIVSNFIGNYAKGYSAYGGSIFNYKSTFNNITGNFVGNFVVSTRASALGGGIYNSADNGNALIGILTGDFIGNYAVSNYADSKGGAIYNYSDNGNTTIAAINGDFIKNYSISYANANGGAIYNYGTNNSSNAHIGNIIGDFINNYTISKNSSAFGGAIYNYNGTIGNKDTDGNLIGGIYGSFINNYAKTESTSDLALGGAIYTNKDMNFIADNKDIQFTGNYTEDSRGKINNAIFVQTSASSSPAISLKAQNNGNIIFNDKIDGGSVSGTNIDRTYQYNLNLTGDETGAIYLNNDIINANITLDSTNLYLGRDDVLNQSNNLTLNSGSLSMINGAVGNIAMQQLNINGAVNFGADVDLANEVMDRVTANTYNIDTNALVNVNKLNLLSYTEKESVNILFADDALANQVNYTGESPVAYSPIYKYDVSYGINQDDNLGYFTFNRAGGGSSNPSDAFSPPVLAEPVAAQSGGKAIVNETLRFAFQHADNFSILPSAVRMSAINQNKYAILDTDEAPKYATMQAPYKAGFWVKPFTTFESMDLKNGPDVDAVTYGTLIGFDTQFRELGRGWHGVTSGYVGYNGSSLSYNGVDTYMNGGLAGVTETLYKGNFFTALTVTAGASAGTTSSSFGSEDFAMLLAGIGSKTGYNFEFKEGKYIIQPSMFINYSFINTFDYTNASGVRIDSDPVHSLQLNPTIRFIANLPHKWQPYASVGMVWNVLNSSKVTANDVVLPRMSVKPYVEYGVGVQRTWADKFTAFFQAMIRNGGRTGVALTGGFRWTVGEDEPIDSVELNTPVKNANNLQQSKTKSQYRRNIEEIQVKSITLPDEKEANNSTKKFSWAFGE